MCFVFYIVSPLIVLPDYWQSGFLEGPGLRRHGAIQGQVLLASQQGLQLTGHRSLLVLRSALTCTRVCSIRRDRVEGNISG